MAEARRAGATGAAAWAVALLLAGVPFARAQESTTAVAYRGRLAIDGVPVDTAGQPGRYDFQFRAFDREQGGQQLGPTLQRPGLPLTEGLFETRLDFGIPLRRQRPLWIEALVTTGQGEERKAVARMRQPLPVPEAPAVAPPQVGQPVTSDAEILARLQAVRVVISDRDSPGQPHFQIDEESFRQAYGLGTPVRPLDVAAIGIVASSELRRQLARSQEQVLDLQIELGQVRFRSNLTLLLLAVVVVSVFLQQRARSTPAPPAGGAAGQPPEPDRGTGDSDTEPAAQSSSSASTGSRLDSP